MPNASASQGTVCIQVAAERKAARGVSFQRDCFDSLRLIELERAHVYSDLWKLKGDVDYIH